MKIEHVAMYVNDLEGAKEFFEKYFPIYKNQLSVGFANPQVSR